MDRALFLDRDGTIIEDLGYMSDPDQVSFLPGAVEALRVLANTDGWNLVIISNQSGVGRGLMTMDAALKVHDRFLELMREAGVPVTDSRFCFHAPEAGCLCRKPSPQLLREAALEHNLDLARSFMVGDRESDIQSGRNAGCRTVWLRTGLFEMNPELPDFICHDWPALLLTIQAAA